jgi:hypothetical protein
MALVDGLSPEDRLVRIPGQQQPRPDDYRDLLAQMAGVESPSLRSLAAFHAGELGFAVAGAAGPFAAVTTPPTPVEEEAHGR